MSRKNVHNKYPGTTLFAVQKIKTIHDMIYTEKIIEN